MQVWLLMTHILVLKTNHWTIDSSGKPLSLLPFFFLTKVRLDNPDISKIFQTPRTSDHYKLLLRFGYGSMSPIRAVKYKHPTTAALVCCGTVKSTTNLLSISDGNHANCLPELVGICPSSLSCQVGPPWASVWYPPLRIPSTLYKPSLVVGAKVLEDLFLDWGTLSCLQLSRHLCGGCNITLLGDLGILVGSRNSDEHQRQGCSSPLYKMVQNLNATCVHLPVSFKAFLGYFKCSITIEILCQ